MIALYSNSQNSQNKWYSSADTFVETHQHIQKISSIQQIRHGDNVFNMEECMRNPNMLLELQCPICSKIMAEPVELTCKHIFCQHCAQKCLQQNRSCPLCRKKCRKYKGQFQLKKDNPSLRTIRNKIKSITFSCPECKWQGKLIKFILKFGESPCIDTHDWSQSPIKMQLKRQQTREQIQNPIQQNCQKKCNIAHQTKIYQKYNSQSILLNNSKFDNQNIFIEDHAQKSKLQHQFLQSEEFKQYFRLHYYYI